MSVIISIHYRHERLALVGSELVSKTRVTMGFTANFKVSDSNFIVTQTTLSKSVQTVVRGTWRSVLWYYKRGEISTDPVSFTYLQTNKLRGT
jgi:hypothetical protein